MAWIGDVEYAPVAQQAHRRAKCPWCGKWQSGDGAGEHDNEACAGQYARRRGTAIFVRVKVGEVYHRPLKKHIRQAIAAAG